MALRDSLAPVIKLLLLIAYAAYILFGLILFILGIYYSTSVEGSNDFVTLTAIAGGFFMMVVGGLGVFANIKTIPMLVLACLFMDVCIFIFLLSAMIVGIFIANGVSDPVSEGIQRAYCDNPATSSHVYCDRSYGGTYTAVNRGVTMRTSNWAGVVELFEAGAPHSCQVYNDAVLALADAKNIAAVQPSAPPTRPTQQHTASASSALPQ
jgi:hypothetical protein